MAGLKPPGPLSLQGNIAKNWKDWIRAFQLYETATELTAKTEPIRCATFLHVAGPAAQQIFDTLQFATEERGKIQPLKDKFKAYCEPKKNLTVTRYLFNTRNQRHGESFSNYMTELRALVNDCEFGTLEGSLLKDRIVCGVHSQQLREKLLQSDELTLEKCIDMCTITEASAEQVKQLAPGSTAADDHVDAIRRENAQPRRGRGRNTQPSRDEGPVCPSCTYVHKSNFCPAKNMQCHACGERGHFSKSSHCPRNSETNDLRPQFRRRYRHTDQTESRTGDLNVRDIEAEMPYPAPSQPMPDDADAFFIDALFDIDGLDTTREWGQMCTINNMDVEFKLDSGAQVDILPEKVFKQTGLVLSDSSVTLRSYSGHTIKPLGQTKGNVQIGKKEYDIIFQVVSGQVKPILGKQTCEKLGLLVRNEVVDVVSAAQAPDSVAPRSRGSQNAPNSENSAPRPGGVWNTRMQDSVKPHPSDTHNARAGGDVTSRDKSVKQTLQSEAFTARMIEEYGELFEGLGRLKGHEYNILLKGNAQPKQNPPRTIPHKIRDKVKTELDRMETLGVIKPVSEPTDWVNSMTIVRKPDGAVRVCLDPRDLNEAIRREHFPMRTFEDVAARMPNAVLFSKFDATSGYWQLPLSNESSLLTTFNTPFGRYRYLVLPFGVSSASEIWQRAMEEEFGDLEGVEIVVDDILVWGENETQHDARVKALLARVKASGLKLNAKKSVMRSDKVEYVGHVISSEGVSPSPARVDSVLQMPYPTNKAELQTFLGMVTYMAKFIPSISEVTAPLRQLTEKGVAWHFEEKHRGAVDKLKQLLTSPPVLKLYDVNAPVAVATDASNSGFGAVLMQGERPVAYASRSLNAAERNYATIEKELCAILYACRKFHDFIVGQRIVVYTDHKPLVGLLGKPLHKLSPRLQRMRMHLLRYDIEIEWIPGREMFVPDALSRIINHSSQANASEFDDRLEVNSIIGEIPVSEQRMLNIKRETERDLTLQLLRQQIENGWPNDKKLVPKELLPYFHYRDELVQIDGIIFRDNRIVVPRAMRREMLDKIHESHLGIVKLKQRARTILFWPGINKQIEDVVTKCPTCQAYKKAQSAEPLLPHAIPERPWSKVGADIFHFEGDNYLLVVDYYSKFPEVAFLKDITSHSVIEQLKNIFARNGIPDCLVSDNGRQFVSAQFRDFENEWEFTHVTSSPNFPQSNGQAERHVQTVKNLMKKARHSGRDPQYALLEYRNTPLDGTAGYAPAEMLNSRLLKSKLPAAVRLLQPHLVPPMRAELESRQEKQKKYFDAGRKTQTLHDLQPKQQVMFRTSQSRWRPGEITRKHSSPRSYVLATPTGEFRRNLAHIRPIPKPGTGYVEGKNDTQPSQRTVQARRSETDTQQGHVRASLSESAGGDVSDPPSIEPKLASACAPTPRVNVTRSGRVSKPPVRLHYD